MECSLLTFFQTATVDCRTGEMVFSLILHPPKKQANSSGLSSFSFYLCRTLGGVLAPQFGRIWRSNYSYDFLANLLDLGYAFDSNHA